MSDIESDTKNGVTSWLYHPFWGVFFFFFIINNWDILYPLIFQSTYSKTVYFIILQIEVISFYNLQYVPRLWYPIIGTVLYFLISPNLKHFKVWIEAFFDSVWNNLIDKAKLIDVKNKNKHLEELNEQYRSILFSEILLTNLSKDAIIEVYFELPTERLSSKDFDFFILFTEESNFEKSFISFNPGNKTFSLSMKGIHSEATAFVFEDITKNYSSRLPNNIKFRAYLCLKKGYINKKETRQGLNEGVDTISTLKGRRSVIPSYVAGKLDLSEYDINSQSTLVGREDELLILTLVDKEFEKYNSTRFNRSLIYFNSQALEKLIAK